MTGGHLRVVAGGEHYALAVECVREVADLGALTPVPRAPAGVLGVRNLRGQIIPVVDLAVALGLPAGRAPGQIVVTEAPQGRVGLAVETASEVVTLPPADEPIHSDRLAGAALVDGVLVGLVDLGAALAGIDEKRVP
jgi:chemotaxis signal transduction protein